MAKFSIKTLYLIAYNLASSAGWAYVLYLTVNAYLEKKSPESLWQIIEMPLTVDTIRCASLLFI